MSEIKKQASNIDEQGNVLYLDEEKVVEYAKMRNPEIEIIFVSAKTGEGIGKLAEWILNNVKEWNS